MGTFGVTWAKNSIFFFNSKYIFFKIQNFCVNSNRKMFLKFHGQRRKLQLLLIKDQSFEIKVQNNNVPFFNTYSDIWKYPIFLITKIPFSSSPVKEQLDLEKYIKIFPPILKNYAYHNCCYPMILRNVFFL